MEYDNYNELDDDWITHFEKSDKIYKDFYKDDVYFLNIHFVYVNKTNEIDFVKEESFLMSEKNYIKRDELIRILKHNMIVDNTKYSLLSVLRYNVTMEPDEILPFLKSEGYNENFLFAIKNIDDIKFEKTINTFQDLNDLMLIFYEKENPKTKNANNMTKKIYLSRNVRSFSKHKKTIRNGYKE